jgi:hypothetical protein
MVAVMNLRPLLTAVLVLFIVCAAAADKPKFYDQVIAIDSKSITLYRSATKEAKFTLTSATKVIVDYKQAKIEDIRPGMKATVYHKADSDEATSISARTIPGY